MLTLNATQLGTTVRVVHTVNSIYVVAEQPGDRFAMVTCLVGTFAGHTYRVDLVNSDPITVGEPLRYSVVMAMHRDDPEAPYGGGPNLITSPVTSVSNTSRPGV